MNDKIIQISCAGVNNTNNTQTDIMIIGLTESGKVVITNDYGKIWVDISPKHEEKGE